MNARRFQPDPETARCRFAEGVKLFNDHHFYEAHEAWEDAWHVADEDHRDFYQGLVQCTVALEHARRGNPRGCLVVFNRARQRLEPLPDRYEGVNLRALLAEMQKMLDPVRGLPDRCFKPRSCRMTDMPVDLEASPQIEIAPAASA